MRQKEKENHNNFTGDLGVYCTGMMVVRSRVKDTKVNRGSDLGSQGCVKALVLQKGAIPSAQPEAGLTLLLDEEVQTSVRCPEQEISGFLPFIRGCCGCLHVPVSQDSGGCSILDEKLWKSSEDLATNCYRN